MEPMLRLYYRRGIQYYGIEATESIKKFKELPWINQSQHCPARKICWQLGFWCCRIHLHLHKRRVICSRKADLHVVTYNVLTIKSDDFDQSRSTQIPSLNESELYVVTIENLDNEPLCTFGTAVCTELYTNSLNIRTTLKIHLPPRVRFKIGMSDFSWCYTVNCIGRIPFCKEAEEECYGTKKVKKQQILLLTTSSDTVLLLISTLINIIAARSIRELWIPSRRIFGKKFTWVTEGEFFWFWVVLRVPSLDTKSSSSVSLPGAWPQSVEMGTKMLLEYILRERSCALVRQQLDTECGLALRRFSTIRLHPWCMWCMSSQSKW